MMMNSTRMLLISILLVLPALAIPQGNPHSYHSYAQMTKALQDLKSRYPEIVHLQSIGKTMGGRDIWIVGLRKGDPEQPRAMLLVAGVEPTQIAGSELALDAIQYFASQYGKVDSLSRLLNSATVYVIPRVSPDATESFFSKIQAEKSTNGRPTDDDHDGLIDEDDADDLNGDGMITLMRIKDPLGEWMADPRDERVMRKASQAGGERGQYIVYSEGLDNDKDERWNEDPVGGVNFNQNFTFNYKFFAEGSGPNQVSEAETRAVADFVFAHPSISVVVSFSPNDNLMSPWKFDPRAAAGEGSRRIVTSVTKEDEQYYQYMGKRFQEITGLKDAPKSDESGGSFTQWAYFHAGRWSFSTFPWWAPELKAQRDSGEVSGRRAPPGPGEPRRGKPEGEDETVERILRTLRWYDAAGIRDVSVPWKAFKHPDFPGKEVQIGGLKPFVLQNPPADSLAVLAPAYNAFFADLAAKLPSVSITNVRTTTLRSGVYRIDLDIVNDGYFPTNSGLGHQLHWVRDVALTLELPEKGSVASGMARQVLDPIAGGGSSLPMSWVVVAPEGSTVTVKAESPACGTSSQRITLR
jgi:hypothetical protein